MIAIETKNLSKAYQQNLVLKDLNIKIKKGEVYGFIGRNGAGKTTTINLILSMIHKTTGEVLINEEVIAFSDYIYKKHIGYVPDVPTFPNYMTAKDYLSYAADMQGIDVSLIPNKIKDVLEFVDLPNSKKSIGAYSRGMKQRLAIAQALIHDPEILIMDEPTSALDPIGRKDVMNIILKLKGKKTIFYSTHILEDVEKVCDRIGLLDQGVLMLEDTIVNIQENFFNNEMFIETEEPKEAVIEFLQNKAVKNNIRPNHKGIICELKGATPANEILKLLVDNKFNIKEFRKVNATLEDVFIKVTNEKVT